MHTSPEAVRGCMHFLQKGTDMAYFPMFIDLKEKECLIIGGGRVAYRKVCVLNDFEAKVTVIASQICDKIRKTESVRLIERDYKECDLERQTLVIAATDDPVLNHEIAETCKTKGIPVNAVDQIEDCTFIFPSYIKEQNLVAAFSSSGKSPVITQYLKDETRSVLNEPLGELTELLGSIRAEVKQTVEGEENRKQVYRKILKMFLEQDELPDRKQIDKIIEKYRKKS